MKGVKLSLQYGGKIIMDVCVSVVCHYICVMQL